MSIAKDTSHLVGLDLVAGVAASMTAHFVSSEGIKGCDGHLADTVVDLEPPFDGAASAAPRRIETPIVLKVWCPREMNLAWDQYNDLHREFAVLRHPVAFEVMGNRSGIWIQIVADEQDLSPVKTAVTAEFPFVRLETLDRDALGNWLNHPSAHIEIEDFFPHPPYYRTMTIHQNMGGSPLDPVYVALRDLTPDEFGIYRVLTVPTAPGHNWHGRVNRFTDVDYRGTQESFFNPSVPNFYHQLPSQYLPMISQREEQKAHPDRPFFAVSVMTMIVTRSRSRARAVLRTLRTALSNFLYGARPLAYQHKDPFLKRLGSEKALRELLLRRESMRHGMLLNSLELSGLFHFPPGSLMQDEDAPLHRIKGFEVHESLRMGSLLIGTNSYMGSFTPVCLPSQVTNQHIYVIGKSGTGKSTQIANLILQEIECGNGVGLIEPHGDLTASILKRIPRSRIHDVVYLDPHDPDFIACINPFDASPQEDKGRLADEITSAFKAGVDTWGPRMENILRQVCYALLMVPGSTMADIGTLLSRSREGEALRLRVKEAVSVADAIRFWDDAFPKYKAEALDPVTNKVSRLMLNKKIAAMFSQRASLIRWRSIIDQGKIFLANLTGLGPDNTSFLGSLMAAGFKEAASSRSDMDPSARRPFSLYIDEFHRFPTSSIEDLLVESRKFGLALRLAHQETGQIDYPTRRAVGTADTLISFCVDVEDAKHIVRELRKEVSEEDILALRVGQAYARVNSRVVDIATLPPPREPDEDMTERVIAASRAKYYVRRDSSVSPTSSRKGARLRLFDTFEPTGGP